MFERERFDRNLNEAHLFERAVCRWYRKNGYESELNKAEDYQGRASHDLTVNGKLYEAKCDYSSIWTGKPFLELEALENSKADFFVYGFPRVIQIPRKELLNLTYSLPRRIIRADKDLEVVTPPLKILFENPYTINLN